MIAINPDNLPYRPSVGVALFNKDGNVLIGQRIGDQGFWQMPQTGIRHNETVVAAARRELQNALTLTDDIRMLAMTTEWLRCDLPGYLLGRIMNGRYRGDEQKWVAARYFGSDETINISDSVKKEFSSWRWENLENMPGMVAPYKRSIYRSVADAFAAFAKPVSQGAPLSKTAPHPIQEKKPELVATRESAEIISFDRTAERRG